MELREEFQAFREECIWLQTCFNTFHALFDGGEEVDAALQNSARLFFAELNIVLVEYWVLLVCRLTDPAVTAGRENLTVLNLLGVLRSHGLLTAEIEATAIRIQSYRDLVNDARNRAVSHADKVAYLQRTVLGQHAAEHVNEFVRDLQRFNDLVGETIGEGPLDYRISSGPGDVYDLLQILCARAA